MNAQQKILSPLQNSILARVRRLGRVKEATLHNFLDLYIKAKNIEVGDYDTEFRLAIDLLVLYGVIRTEQGFRDARVLVANPETTQAEADSEPATHLASLPTMSEIPSRFNPSRWKLRPQ